MHEELGCRFDDACVVVFVIVRIAVDAVRTGGWKSLGASVTPDNCSSNSIALCIQRG